MARILRFSLLGSRALKDSDIPLVCSIYVAYIVSFVAHPEPQLCTIVEPIIDKTYGKYGTLSL